MAFGFPHELTVTEAGGDSTVYPLSEALDAELVVDGDGSNHTIRVELSIAFCESVNKDACYVDIAEVTVRRAHSSDGVSSVASLLYRPEIPH